MHEITIKISNESLREIQTAFAQRGYYIRKPELLELLATYYEVYSAWDTEDLINYAEMLGVVEVEAEGDSNAFTGVA